MTQTATRTDLELDNIPERRMQGHWLLAKLGKRILRPGGIGLTNRLLKAATPSAGDRIVEFGPGVGATAQRLLATHPKSYVGIDPNPQGRGRLTRILDDYSQADLIVGTATDTGLPSRSADLVIGEALMSMHSDEDKHRIVAEAARILAPGGRYAIHELLRRDSDAKSRDAVNKDLSQAIKVGARPLTEDGWRRLLTDNGLQVIWIEDSPMRLLEPSRVIADEGFFGALNFAINLIRNKPARERVRAMRDSFQRNAEHLGAIAIIARKPEHAENKQRQRKPSQTL